MLVLPVRVATYPLPSRRPSAMRRTSPHRHSSFLTRSSSRWRSVSTWLGAARVGAADRVSRYHRTRRGASAAYLEELLGELAGQQLGDAGQVALLAQDRQVQLQICGRRVPPRRLGQPARERRASQHHRVFSNSVRSMSAILPSSLALTIMRDASTSGRGSFASGPAAALASCACSSMLSIVQ